MFKKPTYTRNKDAQGNDDMAIHIGTYVSIQWKSNTHPDGPTPLDVLKLTLERCESIKDSAGSSDGNAKLIYHLTKAIDDLEGKDPTFGKVPK